ncbi:hypothetical protein CSUB01_12144 [Colletotrichum sublineola]|uniref:Uncharacterized protein n=1 Tax=Colletotrichum sublineola TaxID=1173701 RepID=A0A066XSB3_COLSU|nr:hypothetical protein CSUB01_12144 [Colletotrichum sublineola]
MHVEFDANWLAPGHRSLVPLRRMFTMWINKLPGLVSDPDEPVASPPPAPRPVPAAAPQLAEIPSSPATRQLSATDTDAVQNLPAAPTCPSGSLLEPIPAPLQHPPKDARLNLEPEAPPPLAPTSRIDDKCAPWDPYSTRETVGPILGGAN